MNALLELLIVAWLPGAVLFRLPLLDRDRRAALPAEERGYWTIVLSVAVSLSLVLALGALHRYSFKRLLIADLLIAATLAAVARLDLRLGPKARASGPGGVHSPGARAARRLAILPPVGIHHRRQGSRRLCELRTPDRPAGRDRCPGSRRRERARLRARPVHAARPEFRALRRAAIHGLLRSRSGHRGGGQPVPARVPGLDRDRPFPPRTDGRALDVRLLGRLRAALGVFRRGTAARPAGRRRRRGAARAERRPGLVLALSQRRHRHAGHPVRGAAGERAGARRQRSVLRAGRGHAAGAAALPAVRRVRRGRGRGRVARAGVRRGPARALDVLGPARGRLRAVRLVPARADAAVLRAAAGLHLEPAVVAVRGDGRGIGRTAAGPDRRAPLGRRLAARGRHRAGGAGDCGRRLDDLRPGVPAPRREADRLRRVRARGRSGTSTSRFPRSSRRSSATCWSSADSSGATRPSSSR